MLLFGARQVEVSEGHEMLPRLSHCNDLLYCAFTFNAQLFDTFFTGSTNVDMLETAGLRRILYVLGVGRNALFSGFLRLIIKLLPQVLYQKS